MTSTFAQGSPRVSVLVACYNVAPYLSETLDSVMAQSVQDIEIIVVDDGSTDGTADVIKAKAGSDARIVPVFLGRNQGVVKARNTSLDLATGSYVAMIDGDDLWLPTALEHRLQLAALHPLADVIATDFALFSGEPPKGPQHGKVAMGPRAKQFFQDAFASGKPAYLADPFEAVATLHFAWTGAMLMRREAIDKAGRFDPQFKGPEDTLLWLKLAQRGPFVFSPEVTALYRQRPGSLVTTFKGPKELHYIGILEQLEAGEMTVAQRRITRRLRAECHHISAISYAKASRHADARAHAKRAFSLQPKIAHLRTLASLYLSH